MCIPVMLVFVAKHNLYFYHGVVDKFDAAVTTREVGACRKFVYTDKFVNGCRRLGAACSQSQWLLLSKVFKRGSAAVLASLSGAVICRIGDATGASGPTGGWRRLALGGARHNDTVGSWSLGGPSAEAVTSETKPSEEAPERRTRRTHCGRPGDNLGVTACCLPRSPFVFACVY